MRPTFPGPRKKGGLNSGWAWKSRSWHCWGYDSSRALKSYHLSGPSSKWVTSLVNERRIVELVRKADSYSVSFCKSAQVFILLRRMSYFYICNFDRKSMESGVFERFKSPAFYIYALNSNSMGICNPQVFGTQLLRWRGSGLLCKFKISPHHSPSTAAQLLPAVDPIMWHRAFIPASTFSLIWSRIHRCRP